MKKLLSLLILLLFVTVGFAQVPNMRTNLRYDSLLCRYEVYVKPDASTSMFNMGGSQIIIAVPHNVITNYPTLRVNAFNLQTHAPGGTTWIINTYADLDAISAYTESYDYYAVYNSGGSLGALTSNTEVLLFSFSLGQNCIDGLRLWEGSGSANNGTGAIPNAYSDPKHPTQPYGGGGDYETNIYEGSGVETWVGNYDNNPTVIPKPALSITYVCDQPQTGTATITAVPNPATTCSPVSYVWTGSGLWFGGIAPTTNFGYGVSPYGVYDVLYTDANGCQATASLELTANCSPPLPVELISFNVTRDGNVAVLDWVTANEVNNNYFVVQHSTDAEYFRNIDRVYSKNSNSHSVLSYQYIHANPVKGINYYRLKQVDFDGSYEYTDIRSVSFGSNQNISLYPNPTSQFIYINNPDGFDKNSVIEIINNVGQIVRSISYSDNNAKILELNVSDLALGYYFIQIRTSSDLFREQFVITK